MPRPSHRPIAATRRFSSARMAADSLFDYLRQSYLINSRFLSDLIEALRSRSRAKEPPALLSRASFQTQ